jgi:hypothetical protein
MPDEFIKLAGLYRAVQRRSCDEYSGSLRIQP